MTFLVDSLQGLFVPRGTQNPRFKWTRGLGPGLVRQAFRSCVEKNPCSLRVAKPWENIVGIESYDKGAHQDDQPIDAEAIYLAFCEKEKWILAYDNVEDLGILFSEVCPDKLIPDVDLNLADQQFLDYCRDWSQRGDPKHRSSIEMWSRLRQHLMKLN